MQRKRSEMFIGCTGSGAAHSAMLYQHLGFCFVVLASVLRRDGNQSWADGAPRLRKL